VNGRFPQIRQAASGRLRKLAITLRRTTGTRRRNSEFGQAAPLVGPIASAGGREKDKTTLIYNPRITLKGIPTEAADYVVNAKSAIEWIMEEYQDYTEGESAIRNDSNAWSREHDDPAYILMLLQRAIRVSVETMGIVRTLPSLQG